MIDETLIEKARRYVEYWADLPDPMAHICLWLPCGMDTISNKFHFCAEHELIMRANGYEPTKEAPEETGNGS